MLWQHLVDKYGLSHSRADAASSRKRKHLDENKFLNWTPDNRISSSKQRDLETSTISPQLLSEPTSAACHVDELDCVKDLDLDETPLDGCITRGRRISSPGNHRCVFSRRQSLLRIPPLPAPFMYVNRRVQQRHCGRPLLRPH